MVHDGYTGTMLHLSIALNSESTAQGLRMALNVELPGGNVPEWVQLIPAGPTVTGQDGRSWKFGEVEARSVQAWFSARKGAPMLIDWEHASEHLAPKGHEAPAAGWVTALELRDGALWGRVEWTERAAAQIARREYRFLSPVFLHTQEDRRILRLVSAGLTNVPNFLSTALNQRQEVHMDLTALIAALGLQSGSTLEQAVTAINTMRAELTTAKADLVTARNQAQAAPSLDKFVPREDYDKAVTKAKNATDELAAFRKAQADAEVDAEIEAALKAGKITPATREYHKAQCQTEGGLARFKEFVKAAPTIAGESGLEGKKPEGQAKALNAEERKIAEMFGNTPEDLVKYGQA
ncbi:phage protease [Desulfocurvibacter africanus]|uniref:phage protease n=1 Tax=Desulfocurvibacter africanus TaxID=873 RepID=UPI000401E72D|nr:phage protease [Desulfocurvibacter africanus]